MHRNSHLPNLASGFRHRVASTSQKPPHFFQNDKIEKHTLPHDDRQSGLRPYDRQSYQQPYPQIQVLLDRNSLQAKRFHSQILPQEYYPSCFGMQRIANPLKQREMEHFGVQPLRMQWIANPMKQRGMEHFGVQPLRMQRIANPLKQRGKQRGMERIGMKPIANYPFLHPPGADKHSFHLFPIMPQLLLPQTIA